LSFFALLVMKKNGSDDEMARDDSGLGKSSKQKTGNPQSGMMPEAHSNRRFPNRMALTQEALMLLTYQA
jgi:hypothetical protein